MKEKVNALIISKEDSVAVAITELKSGDTATFVVDEKIIEVNIIQDIPIYHKFSVLELYKDDLVYKYGQVIGRTTELIMKGQHVHTHNIVSANEVTDHI
ncbi:UxaA family hydrolase [Alkalicella caledoniensis]|uniref:UxaA family hydrolase n=1 Tax=Alkalicella caledoniensis TaxID=2731377 RepID=A0A7G9W7P1_ALKCA|nr:UxaA family hydrolase [Alkalicella caledoniensis]QNO14703.1 UxaA family hydrolase [Alkalicella caledoniensis]